MSVRASTWAQTRPGQQRRQEQHCREQICSEPFRHAFSFLGFGRPASLQEPPDERDYDIENENRGNCVCAERKNKYDARPQKEIAQPVARPAEAVEFECEHADRADHEPSRRRRGEQYGFIGQREHSFGVEQTQRGAEEARRGRRQSAELGTLRVRRC